MFEKFITQLPALQIIIPLIGALLVVCVARSKKSARLITKATSFLMLVNIGAIIWHCINMQKVSMHYHMGGWAPPIGIEHIIDPLALFCLILISLIFAILLILKDLLKFQIEYYLENSKIPLFYSMLMLNVMSISGIVITRDLFNLYVFIEIAALSAYCLLSLGPNKKAVLGAFEYLILGTIGATLILMGIGLIYSITGSLNMGDIQEITKNQYTSKLLISGAIFFIIGAMLKIALFPMHIWMVKAYSFAAPTIMIFISSLSGLLGFAILLKFLFNTLNYNDLASHYPLKEVFTIMSTLSIIIGASLALVQNSLRKIVIFSGLANIGYMFVFLIFAEEAANITLLLWFLLADTLNKVGFFIIIAIIEAKHEGVSNLENINGLIQKSPFISLLLCLITINNAGIPLTIGFINKINLMTLLLHSQYYVLFVIIILGSVMGLFYNYTIINSIMFNSNKNTHTILYEEKNIEKLILFLIFVIIMCLMLFYNDINPLLMNLSKILVNYE